jgi:hypothetical protein
MAEASALARCWAVGLAVALIAVTVRPAAGQVQPPAAPVAVPPVTAQTLQFPQVPAAAPPADLFASPPPWARAEGNGGVRTGGRGPIIPEPMVFDLVRPLGARRGELEFNTLGLIPISRERGTPVVEWAPEVEYAVRDNLAFEFELPFGDGRLEAYKFAGQYTFGTGFEERYIHGAQGIVQYDRDRRSTTLTLLYLWGVRFDESCSMLGMAGARTEFAGDTLGRRTGFLTDPLEGAPEFTTIGRQGGSRTEMLINLSLFNELSDRLILGFETNVARGLEGEASLLLMPQFHWGFTDDWQLQAGVGTQHVAGNVVPLAAFRLIREW